MSRFDGSNCPLKHIVVATPTGTSMNGVGCLYTGGHCLPCDDCENRVNTDNQRAHEQQQWDEAMRGEQERFYRENPHEGD